MFYYLLTGLTLVSSFIFFKIDAHTIISTTLTTKYQSWKALTGLVATQQTSKMAIIAVSLSMIFEVLYVSLSAYLNGNIKQLDKNTYEISYVIKGKLYKMTIKPSRLPCPILKVTNKIGTDVSDKILPYYGPRYDWQQKVVSPSTFNEEELHFHLDDREIMTFKTEEPICFCH